ncbi:hypothetical protein, partial [Microvirga sp. P5_D2]
MSDAARCLGTSNYHRCESVRSDRFRRLITAFGSKSHQVAVSLERWKAIVAVSLSAWEADMRWLCSVAMLLALFADPTDVQAVQGAKERSIDELPLTAEVDRTGDFLAWGFDALWMMTAGTTALVNGEWQSVGSSLVRVDGKTNQAEDNVIQGATARVRG